LKNARGSGEFFAVFCFFKLNKAIYKISMAEYHMVGNFRLEGDLTVVGNTTNQDISTITAQDPLIGLGTPSPGAGYSGGVVIEQNYQDITQVDLTGNVVAATTSTVTIQQSAATNYYYGWMIKIISGTGANQYSLISASTGAVVSLKTIFTVVPDTTSVYTLSEETHAAIVYQPASGRFYMGMTPTDNTQQVVIEASPRPLLVERILQSQSEIIYYVAKSGLDTNNGGTIAEAFLTFSHAVSVVPSGGTIVCFDNGVYSEGPVFNYQNVFAPNCTLEGALFDNATGEFGTVTTLTANYSTITIGSFSNAVITTCTINFINGQDILAEDCNITGQVLAGAIGVTAAGGNVYINVTSITAAIAVNVEHGTAVVNCSNISSATTGQVSTGAVLYMLGGQLDNYTFTVGGGTIYYADAKRVQNHIENFNNPHDVTIAQVSPLTTKGDILAFSTVNTRFPIGSNGQILTVNSADPTGLEWTNLSLQGYEVFTVAPGEYLLTNTTTTIANFVWNQNQYSQLASGQLLFYNTGNLTITLIGAATYATQTYTSAGYQILPITNPSANDIMYLQVSTAGTGNIYLYNVVLTFGSVNPISQSLQSFTIAPGKYIATNSPQSIGVFAWNNSQYNQLANGQLIFYNSGQITVTFIGAATYATQTYTSAGYQTLSIVNPTANDLIQLQISSTATGVYIYNTMLTFGQASIGQNPSTSFTYNNVSGTYAVSVTDDHIICNTSGGPVTLNLPAAFKKEYVIVDSGNAGTNNITINATGTTINGTASYVIGTNHGGITIFSDTIVWYAY